MTRRVFIVAMLASTAVSAQPPKQVQVIGPRSVTLSVSELAGMPRTVVTATAHERTAAYEGVSMRELLTGVGVPLGDGLRGRELAAAVVVTGADGYKVVFGLAEFDPGFTDRIAILADKCNGIALAADEGPFQLILTGEKRPARWVRQVATIEVQALAR
jgi:hypothetical protein